MTLKNLLTLQQALDASRQALFGNRALFLWARDIVEVQKEKQRFLKTEDVS